MCRSRHVAGIWIALATSALAPALCAQDIKVTLLGTGCPPALMNRFGPSTLVEAGGRGFLVDAGRGASPRCGCGGLRGRST